MEQGEPAIQAKTGLLARIKTRLNKRFVIVFCVVIGILAVGGIAWWLYDYNGGNLNANAIAEFRRDYQHMKNNEKPATDSTASKAAYYQELATKAAAAGDYRGAIEAFGSRSDVLGEKMPAWEHIQLATYHCRLEDKDGAVKALDQGIRLPQASSEDKSRLAGGVKLINEKGCEAWVQLFDQQ